MDSRIVISLDFELRWGVADKLPDDPKAYRRNLDGANDAVLAMLEMFGQERIGATWATVGALACADWDEYHARAPKAPAYQDPRIRFRREWQALDPQGRVHFAPRVVRAIADAPGQELASHTFSHIYLREAGCLSTDVAADCRAIADLFRERFGAAPTSLVFPRNQVAQTATLKEFGIERWRTNPKAFYWNAMRRDEQQRWVRGLRLVDDVVTTRTRRAPTGEMRASYLVRFPLPERAWALHAASIKRDARRLQRGETLHLWWHPHNMGADLSLNLVRLKELIQRLREAVPSHTRFVSMADCGEMTAREGRGI